MKISSTEIKVRGTWVPYFKINTPCFCYPFFFEEYLNSQVAHPNPSGLTSRIHSLIFLQTPEGFVSLQNICLIFSQTCISHHGWENFQVHGGQITGKYICNSEKKNQEIFIYTHRQNFPSRSYHHLPGRGRLLISQTAFFQKSIPTSTNRGRKLWECYSGWKFNKITNFCKLNSTFCISIER